MIFFKACLVKREYHVKGILFIVNEKKVVFYSHFFKDQKNKKYLCNYDKKHEGKCLGSLFPCLKKEENRKIQFNISNLRMVLKRLYYYRRTGIEFFTRTKSYLFNIGENNSNDKNVIFDTVSSIFDPIMNKSEDLNFQLYLTEEKIIGWIKVEYDLFDKDRKIKYDEILRSKNKDKNTVNLFYRIISRNFSEFKVIMLINLISNRSLNDLYQYPVFPVLNFYIEQKDNGSINKIKRELDKHIGFNEQVSDKAKERFDIIMDAKIAEENTLEDGEVSFYFNTNYSNLTYTTGFLLRLFPYSFMSIEMQGENFDTPNRLFYSVPKTFSNMTSQKSDLRELIPEFFYLPEMFININNINFGTLSEGKKVDDCLIPNDNKGETFEKFCIFIDEMRNDLENDKKDKDLSGWFKIIFGLNQRYENPDKKEGQYFQSTCYIDNLSEEFSKRIIDPIIIGMYEFGIIPLKTILVKNTFEHRKKDFIPTNFFNSFHQQDNLDFGIDIKNSNKKMAKEAIANLIDEIDLNDIKSCCANKFLNMIATCSFDGIISVYIKPNKLISIIKDPNGSYFDEVFLCSNPFPCIIAVKESRYLISYSISGMIIKTYSLDKKYEVFVDYVNKRITEDWHDVIVLIPEKEKEKDVKILKVPFFIELKKK